MKRVAQKILVGRILELRAHPVIL